MPRVAALWRFPVKSAAGERVDAFAVGRQGPRGDRRWGVIDADGTVVSAKHPRRGGRLLQVAAAYHDAEDTTAVRPPGSGWLRAGSAEADHALSDWLGRPVRLCADVPDGLRLHRVWPEDAGLVPEWEKSARPGSEAVTGVVGAGRTRTFVDYGAVHVVTSGALDRLAADAGAPVDPLRFRANVVLDGLADPEHGERLQVGEVVLRVDLPTPRCVIPGLAHTGLPDDLALLRTLARHDRRQVGGLGRAACFGSYAVVEQPGAIAVGDAVRAL